MDIRQIIHHLRQGSSYRQTGLALGLDWRTVKKYYLWAKAHDLLAGELPPPEKLQKLLEASLPEKQPPQNISSVEPYRALVEKLVDQEVEVAAIRERLKERGFTGSYAAVYRFVRRLKPRGKDATVRVERPPGEESQVDFGYAGMMIDPETGKLRRTWAFVMTLSWSRHQYVEFVFDQSVATWLRCHRNAFAFFEGVPERVVSDNLKAAILKAVFDDPAVQASYRECALHYGFRITPCRVATPEHKGKVEKGGVHYVKRNFLGGREPTAITQANRDVVLWCNTTAGLRHHGTTKEQPLQRFLEVDKERLRPLPETPYDLAVWKQLKLARDCYVEFDQSYYSAPHRLIGQQLWVCGGLSEVRIFDADYHLLATHERAGQPGNRLTHLDHLPPEKVPGLTLNREQCQQEAAQIGPATARVAQSLLDDPVLDRLPTVGRLLRLRERYGGARLEAACRRALAFDDPAYKTIKGILQNGFEQQLPAESAPTPPATAFVRTAQDFFGHLGGETWN